MDKRTIELLKLVADPKNWDFQPICDSTGVRFVTSWTNAQDIQKFAQQILDTLSKEKE